MVLCYAERLRYVAVMAGKMALARPSPGARTVRAVCMASLEGNTCLLPPRGAAWGNVGAAVIAGTGAGHVGNGDAVAVSATRGGT